MTTKQLIADTLPSGWKIGKLKYFYKFETGFTPPTTRPEYYTPDGEMWVTIADMCNSEVTSSKNRISKLYADSIKAKKVPRGSLLYSFKLSLGKTSIAGCDTYTNEAIASFSSEKNPCINFLKYSSCMIEDNALENIYGAKLLNRERIENAIIVFPPIKTQERIAEYLDKRCSRIDECIKKLQAQLQLVSSYRQSLITRAVTKGLDPNVEMKDSGVEELGEIPSHWHVARLGMVCKLRDGTHFSPKIISEGYPYITAEDIHGEGIDYKNTKKISIEDYQRLVQENCRPHRGDVLLVKDGATTGRTGLMIDDAECVTLSSVAMLTPNTTVINSRYLRYVLDSMSVQHQIQRTMMGAAMPRTTLSRLSRYWITIPSLKDQRQITEFISKNIAVIDNAKSNIIRTVQKLTEYRSSLISATVTGQLAIEEAAE